MIYVYDFVYITILQYNNRVSLNLKYLSQNNAIIFRTDIL